MSQETILMVEDEHDIQELLKFHLERENFTVEAVDTGEEGLQFLKTGDASLILLDLMLPGMDGLEVCRRLKAQPETRDIPIIMLTAKDSEADIVTGLEIGRRRLRPQALQSPRAGGAHPRRPPPARRRVLSRTERPGPSSASARSRWTPGATRSKSRARKSR